MFTEFCIFHGGDSGQCLLGSMPCGDVLGHKLFRGPCCLPVQGEMMGFESRHRYRKAQYGAGQEEVGEDDGHLCPCRI